jgi:hypothetical protein
VLRRFALADGAKSVIGVISASVVDGKLVAFSVDKLRARDLRLLHRKRVAYESMKREICGKIDVNRANDGQVNNGKLVAFSVDELQTKRITCLQTNNVCVERVEQAHYKHSNALKV